MAMPKTPHINPPPPGGHFEPPNITPGVVIFGVFFTASRGCPRPSITPSAPCPMDWALGAAMEWAQEMVDTGAVVRLTDALRAVLAANVEPARPQRPACRTEGYA